MTEEYYYKYFYFFTCYNILNLHLNPIHFCHFKKIQETLYYYFLNLISLLNIIILIISQVKFLQGFVTLLFVLSLLKIYSFY